MQIQCSNGWRAINEQIEASSTEARYGSTDKGSATQAKDLKKRSGSKHGPASGGESSYALLKWLEQKPKQEPWNPLDTAGKGKTLGI